MTTGSVVSGLRSAASIYGVATRTSPARWVGWVSCVSAPALALASDTSSMLPGLADPLNLALTSVVYIAPLAAGGAAVNAAALRNGGVTTLASSSRRGLGAAQGVAYVAAVAWQVLAYVILAGVLVLRADRSGLSTPPFALLPVLAIALLLVAGAVGLYLGDRISNGLAAPTAAFVVFVWLFLGSYLPPSRRFLAPVLPEVFFQNFLQPSPRILASTIALGVAAVVVLLAVTARRLGPPGLVAVLVLGAAGTLGLSGGPLDPVELRAPVTPVCLTVGSTTLCGWPESRHELARGLDAIITVRRAVDGVLPTSDTYRETGLPTRYGTRVQLARAEGDDPVFLASLAVTPHLDCKPYDSAPAEAAGEVAAWVLVRTGAEDIRDPDVNAIARASLPDQRAWVEQRLRRAGACRS